MPYRSESKFPGNKKMSSFSANMLKNNSLELNDLSPIPLQNIHNKPPLRPKRSELIAPNADCLDSLVTGVGIGGLTLPRSGLVALVPNRRCRSGD